MLVLAVVFVNVIVAFVLLEAGLRLLKPRHLGLRSLLYKSTLQTDYSRVDTLPDLMAKSIIGDRPRGRGRGSRSQFSLPTPHQGV